MPTESIGFYCSILPRFCLLNLLVLIAPSPYFAKMISSYCTISPEGLNMNNPQ